MFSICTKPFTNISFSLYSLIDTLISSILQLRMEDVGNLSKVLHLTGQDLGFSLKHSIKTPQSTALFNTCVVLLYFSENSQFPYLNLIKIACRKRELLKQIQLKGRLLQRHNKDLTEIQGLDSQKPDQAPERRYMAWVRLPLHAFSVLPPFFPVGQFLCSRVVSYSFVISLAVLPLLCGSFGPPAVWFSMWGSKLIWTHLPFQRQTT